MRFTKMHGIGNDYVYVDCFAENVEDPSGIARKISDRHFGIGSDGLVLICPSTVADFRMDMYNSDGSRGKMCGNAIRCIGKYVFEKGLTRNERISIETLSGIKDLKLNLFSGKVKTVTVDMGAPSFAPLSLPVDLPGEEVVLYPLQIGGQIYKITCVSMGNPHAVIFTERLDDLPLSTLGPLVQQCGVFPEGVNVEFITIENRSTLHMRVWERGAGETMACGTGACASLAAACRVGKTDTNALVHLRGGDLMIKWDKQTNHIMMTGGATKVFEGTIDFKEDF